MSKLTVFHIVFFLGGFVLLSSASLAHASTNIINEDQKILASDGAAIDRFGGSVDLASDGTTAVVGSNLDNNLSGNAGSAYVFTKNNDGFWVQTKKLVASDASNADFLGESVSISGDGDVIVAGSRLDDVSQMIDAGSAYVFTKNNDGLWVQTKKLVASDAASGDQFGVSASVSADGTTAVIGSHFGDSSINNSGSAYVFEKMSETWVQTKKLVASDAASGDRFGESVSVSGDGKTVVVGAFADDEGSAINRGAAYVFTKNEQEQWVESDKFIGSKTFNSDQFGASVKISDDGMNIVASAITEDTSAGSNNGAVYVFNRVANDQWEESVRLLPSDGSLSTQFFGSILDVSADGTTVIAGSPEDNGAGRNNGAAYVFTLQENIWNETKLIASDDFSEDKFGSAVGLSADGTTAIAGSPFDHVNGTSDQGSAYLFVIRDILPKIQNIPSDIVTVSDNNMTGVLVDYAPPTAVDGNNQSIPVTCNPDSGTVFLLGVTIVNCVATDSDGNMSAETFRITVHGSYPKEGLELLHKAEITINDGIHNVILHVGEPLPKKGELNFGYGFLTDDPKIMLMTATHGSFLDDAPKKHSNNFSWHNHLVEFDSTSNCEGISNNGLEITQILSESSGTVKVGGSILKIKNMEINFVPTYDDLDVHVSGSVMPFEIIPVFDDMQNLDVVCIDSVNVFTPNRFLIETEIDTKK